MGSDRMNINEEIERAEKERMGPKKYGEKILKEFREEMEEIYTKYRVKRKGGE
jgi:hypothetical protein